MEQKRMSAGSDRETIRGLQARILELEEKTGFWMHLLKTLPMPFRSLTEIW